MYRHQSFWAFAIALIACAHAQGYGASGPASYGPASASDSDATAAAAVTSDFHSIGANGATANVDGVIGSSNNAGNAGSDAISPNSYGSSQNLPYSSVNTKGNTMTSSITYPQNKGEILIHRPAPIIVKRPPTKVLVNHPPLVVKPAPVVLHKPPAIVLRKVYVKHHPRPVRVEPVYVNVVKPPAEKYFVNEKQQQFAGQQYSGQQFPAQSGSGYGQQVGSNAAATGLPAFATGTDSAATNAGYQLLNGNQGIAALASITGNNDYGASSAAAAPSQLAYGSAPSAPGPYPHSSY